MAASEEAAIAAIIAAIFLLNKEGEESMESVMYLSNVLVMLFTKERRHIPRIAGYVVRHLGFQSQHSVHSAPGSRMDGMPFCPFRNRNAEQKMRAFYILPFSFQN